MCSRKMQDFVQCYYSFTYAVLLYRCWERVTFMFSRQSVLLYTHLSWDSQVGQSIYDACALCSTTLVKISVAVDSAIAAFLETVRESPWIHLERHSFQAPRHFTMLITVHSLCLCSPELNNVPRLLHPANTGHHQAFML